jgi:hypothetical protein
VDKQRLTQVERAMKELGMQMIAAYSQQHGAVRRGVSGRGRAACPRNRAAPGSPRLTRRTASCSTITFENSMRSSRGQRGGARHGLPALQSNGF